MISTFIYDGSWYGLCTCIFSAWEYKIPDVSIVKAHTQSASLFGESKFIETNVEKAERVLKKLSDKKYGSIEQTLFSVFLSEQPSVENIILRYIQYIIATPAGMHNAAHKDVYAVQQLAKKVSRERHRMKAFVRFNLGSDGLYYAGIEPDYNVLPLISKHFRDRYADQRWLIYDMRRKYGLYYNLNDVTEVELTHSPDANTAKDHFMLHESEAEYKTLWQQYFKSVNIPERKNTKLHVQHVPKRYWKHLPEKW